jgi:DNA-binding transcriptional LysR family regulator
MDRFGDLDVFSRVVTARSMSGAGRELGLSPAVISKRIRRLEERLGVRLLQRTTRQLALTEAGQGFYERVVGILAAIEEAEAWAAQGSATARGCSRSPRRHPSGGCTSPPTSTGSSTPIPASRSI